MPHHPHLPGSLLTGVIPAFDIVLFGNFDGSSSSCNEECLVGKRKLLFFGWLDFDARRAMA
jgi:hypothetical protein